MMPMGFYRAVSFAELADFRKLGRLRAVDRSCEGKHLACSLEAARRWGVALHGKDRFAVLMVTVPISAAEAFYQWEQLDGIGPACFATMDQLAEAVVCEVTDEP